MVPGVVVIPPSMSYCFGLVSEYLLVVLLLIIFVSKPVEINICNVVRFASR